MHFNLRCREAAASSSLLPTLKEHELQTQLVKGLGRQVICDTLQPDMLEFKQRF